MKERKRFRQRSKSEPKGQPLPKEIYEKLLDSAVPLIDKVALASRYRQEYNYSVRDMATLLKIDEMLYYRMLRILGSENEMLIDKIRKNECTVNLALKIAREAVQPGDSACDSYFRYKWIQNIDERCENYEIIYESRNNILYRSGDGVFLGVSNGENEKSCQLDDTPRILDVLIECLQNGGFIRWEAGDFVLYAGNDSRYGKLSYFIVSKITGKSRYDVKKARVSYKRAPYEGVYDLRIANLTCVLLTCDIHPEACGGFVVTRNKSNIVIIDESHNDVYQTDYCNWLYHFLQGKRDKFRFQARDNRLCVVVGGRVEYLYHIVMAIHLYGVPASEYSLRKKLRQFREEYIEKGYNVDHLDTDVNNNCLSNLILMTIAQNRRKAKLQSKIRKLELPLFCWQERYDDTSIRAMAGYVHPLRLPHYVMQGVFSVDEYLDALENVAECLENNKIIIDEFEKLERELEEKGEQNECN